MNTSNLVHIYAKSFVEIALETKSIRYWQYMLKSYVKILQSLNKNNILSYNIISPNNIVNMFILKSKNKFNLIGKNLIYLMASNNRLPMLPDILKEFNFLIIQNKKFVSVTVISARNLDKNQIFNVKQVLENILHKKVKITYKVNDEIVAGILIKMQDKIIDASIRGNINRLKKQIESILY